MVHNDKIEYVGYCSKCRQRYTSKEKTMHFVCKRCNNNEYIKWTGEVKSDIEYHDENSGYFYNIVCKNLDKDTQITYYKDPKNNEDWGCEIYVGENYVVGSKKRSYSKNYRHLHQLPKKYMKQLILLRQEYVKKYGV